MQYQLFGIFLLKTYVLFGIFPFICMFFLQVFDFVVILAINFYGLDYLDWITHWLKYMDDEIYLLIADDHNLVGKLIKLLLVTANKKFKVDIVYNGKSVFDHLKKNRIDVLILDIDMPIMDGITVLRKIKKNNPEIKVLMVSNHTQSWVIKRCLNFGADGYISKYDDDSEILKGIEAILKNEKFLCQKTIDCLNSNCNEDKNNPELEHTRDKLGNLSKREIEILKLVVEEYSSKDISDRLIISVRTVETHRKNILKKLGVKNSLGLIRLFIETDLLKSIED